MLSIWQLHTSGSLQWTWPERTRPAERRQKPRTGCSTWVAMVLPKLPHHAYSTENLQSDAVWQSTMLNYFVKPISMDVLRSALQDKLRASTATQPAAPSSTRPSQHRDCQESMMECAAEKTNGPSMTSMSRCALTSGRANHSYAMASTSYTQGRVAALPCGRHRAISFRLQQQLG